MKDSILNRYSFELCDDLRIFLDEIPDAPLVSLQLPSSMDVKTKEVFQGAFEIIRPELEKKLVKHFMLHVHV